MTKLSRQAAALSTEENEDLIDVLIAISVVAKRLAAKLQKEKEEENEQAG